MIEQKMLDAGSAIEFPNVVQEYMRNGKKYVFVGWDTQASVLLENMRINAVYAEVGKECKISYVVDDEVVRTDTVISGTALQYAQFTPTKNSDKFSYFVFSNWIGPEEGTYVVEDITLVASFRAEPLPDDLIIQDDRGKITTFFNFEINTVVVVIVVVALVVAAWYILFKKR
jgi:hypothetical protein